MTFKIKLTGRGRVEGFSYLSVMAIVVMIGISLTAAGYEWKTVAKREREKELLFRGDEIRSAILLYVNADPLKRYPHSLEDLIKDPKNPRTVRYLRKIYKDPMTNEDWAILTDPVNGLVGVHSKSGDKPIKRSNFKIQDRCFEGKESYQEWLFIAQPQFSAVPVPPQGAGGQPVPLPQIPQCPPAISPPGEKK